MTEPVMVGETPASASRLPLLLGIGVVVLLAALFLPGILAGGDDEAFEPSGTPTTLGPGVTTTTLPPADPDSAPPPRTFEVFSSKNPFTPLADTGAGGGGGTGTGTGGGSTPVITVPPPTGGGGTSDPDVIIVRPSDGSTSGDGTTTDGETSTGGSGTDGTTTTPGSNEPRPAQRVALLEVFTSGEGEVVANVRVNDTVHEVGEGDAFATNYRVVSLSQAERCGQFLFGDDRFRLCEGEQLLK